MGNQRINSTDGNESESGMSSKTVTLSRSQSASRRTAAPQRTKDGLERYDSRSWQPFTMDMAPRPQPPAASTSAQPLALDAERQRIIQVQRLQAQQQQHQFLSQQLQMQIHLQQQQLLANRIHRARSGDNLSQVEAAAAAAQTEQLLRNRKRFLTTNSTPDNDDAALPSPGSSKTSLPSANNSFDAYHVRGRSIDEQMNSAALNGRVSSEVSQTAAEATSSARSRENCKPIKARRSPEVSTHPLERARGNSQPDLPLKRKSPQLNVLSGLSPLSPTTPLPGSKRTTKSAASSPATSYVDLSQALHAGKKRGSQTSLTTLSKARASPRRNASSPSLLISGIEQSPQNAGFAHEFTDEPEDDALGGITFRPRLQRRRLRPSDGDDSSIGFAGGSERSDYEAKRSKALSARRRTEFETASSIGFSSPAEDDVHSDSALGLTFGKGSFAGGTDGFGRVAISSPEGTDSFVHSAFSPNTQRPTDTIKSFRKVLLLLRLLAVVPATLGIVTMLFDIALGNTSLGRPLKTSKLDMVLCLPWATLTGILCFELTTGLTQRWLIYYSLAPTLLRLLSLQSICWPSTAITVRYIGQDDLLLAWIVVGTTTACSRSVQIWVTSNVPVATRPPSPGTKASLSKRPLWLRNLLDAMITQNAFSMTHTSSGAIAQRKWEWSDIGRTVWVRVSALYFLTTWYLLWTRHA